MVSILESDAEEYNNWRFNVKTDIYQRGERAEKAKNCGSPNRTKHVLHI